MLLALPAGMLTVAAPCVLRPLFVLLGFTLTDRQNAAIALLLVFGRMIISRRPFDPMFAYGGQYVSGRVRQLGVYSRRPQQGFGVVVALTAIAT
jgi:hypothetical protein